MAYLTDTETLQQPVLPPIEIAATATSSRDTYHFQSRLGRGISGDVHRAVRQSDGAIVAIKRISLDSEHIRAGRLRRESVRDAALREYRISRLLEERSQDFCRRNAVCATELFEQAQLVFLVFPLEDPTTITRFEQSKLSPLLPIITPRSVHRQFSIDAAQVGAEILRVLAKLHTLRVYHLDLKGDNILISLQSRQIKLIDWGLACADDTNNNSNSSPSCARQSGLISTYGTDPRLRRAVGIDPARRSRLHDVYGAGLTLYSMVLPEKYGRIPDDRSVRRMPWLPKDFENLIRSMLGPYERRRSAADYAFTLNSIVRTTRVQKRRREFS